MNLVFKTTFAQIKDKHEQNAHSGHNSQFSSSIFSKRLLSQFLKINVQDIITTKVTSSLHTYILTVLSK